MFTLIISHLCFEHFTVTQNEDYDCLEKYHPYISITKDGNEQTPSLARGGLHSSSILGDRAAVCMHPTDSDTLKQLSKLMVLNEP